MNPHHEAFVSFMLQKSEKKYEKPAANTSNVFTLYSLTSRMISLKISKHIDSGVFSTPRPPQAEHGSHKICCKLSLVLFRVISTKPNTETSVILVLALSFSK